MRFHWGLGVGHTYSHADKKTVDPASMEEQLVDRAADEQDDSEMETETSEALQAFTPVDGDGGDPPIAAEAKLGISPVEDDADDDWETDGQGGEDNLSGNDSEAAALGEHDFDSDDEDFYV